jgi:hypothetical protein
MLSYKLFWSGPRPPCRFLLGLVRCSRDGW